MVYLFKIVILHVYVKWPDGTYFIFIFLGYLGSSIEKINDGFQHLFGGLINLQILVFSGYLPINLETATG
jgi:hypothetical protein